MKRRDWLALGGVGALAALGGAVVAQRFLGPGDGSARLLEASLVDLDGRPRRVSEWRGRVLLCNFWATWCPPCREEIPMLIDIRRQYASNGFEILGIAVDIAPKVSEFAKAAAISYPVLLAPASGVDLMRGLGNASGGLPYSVALDRDGSVAYRKLGLLRRPELEARLAGLLRH